MKIDVRRVQPSADLDELLGNLIAIREELDLPEGFSAQELRTSLEQIANTPTSYLLVASIEDRPLGFALAHSLGHETPLTATRLVIDVLFVPASERQILRLWMNHPVVARRRAKGTQSAERLA